MPIPGYKPMIAPPAVFDGVTLPEPTANWVSRVTFHWITPILRVGYSRPLQADDLCSLPDDLQSQNIATALHANFVKRVPPSKRPRTTRLDECAEAQQPISPAGQRCTAYNAKSRQPGTPATRFSLPPIIELPLADAPERRTTGLGMPEHVGHQMGDKAQAAQQEPLQEIHGSDTQPSTVTSEGLNKRKAKKVAEGKLFIENGRVYDQSLFWAMYQTVRRRWWRSVILKLLGAILQVTAPLITRLIIEQIQVAHAYHKATTNGGNLNNLQRPKSIGYGVGLAAGLFGMLMAASLLVYQALQIGSVIGFMMRSALIDLIGRKSLVLSSRSRLDSTNGKLITMVSADASYLDFSAPMTIDLVVQPIQILVGLALIIYTLGYSALVGLAVLCLAGPIQAFMFTQMVKYRGLQLTHIDARTKLLSMVVNNIRNIKIYAYTQFFGSNVQNLREKELEKLRVNGLNRATMNATMSFIPILAAVLTFITYGLSGHTLDAATIFTGLQFFNVLKTPISFLPMCFTAVSDAIVAIRRIGALLQSEEMPKELDIRSNMPFAIQASGDYIFEQQGIESTSSDTRGEDIVLDEKNGTPVTERPFALLNIDFRVPKGSFVCVVGRVGTGKSALMQALLGEMRQQRGSTAFSSPVSYVPQQAWIHSGTIRDNITFSEPAEAIDENRLNWVIDACCLREDLKAMKHSLQTEVGAGGLTLSGGQRQRLALARAAYDTSQIVLLDDTLSAIDAHVSHQVLHNCILQGPLAGRTRILVTHNMDIISKADLIVVMDRDGDIGGIVQQGSFASLTRSSGILQHLAAEFARPVTTHSMSTRPKTSVTTVSRPFSTRRPVTIATTIYPEMDEQLASPMEQDDNEEERETGAISWKVYQSYIRASGSTLWVAISLLLLVLVQLTNVANSLFLGWWSGDEFGLGQNMYMAVYAGLGLGIAIFTWSASFLLFITGIRASRTLFRQSWDSVLRAKVGWLDKTPNGRIISRLTKDIEALDDRLAMSWEQFLTTALAVFGTFGLVLYTYPYLGLAFIPLTFFYYLCASFYRQTSREVKRIDSITRSHIYSSFGEQLDGRSVIRAFQKRGVFEARLQDSINRQCQAYIVTLTIQRWLGIRLDLFSNLLVMLITIFGILFRNSVEPAKFGVVLTYTLAAAQLFANLVSLYAQVEQEMNNAERVLHYTFLPTEADPHLSTDPQPPWPTDGAISFSNVNLRYSPELPLVLKDLSFEVRPGEKIGVIGRTGAGKSSLLQALFRMVEIGSGCTRVDKMDIKHVGLDTLRGGLAVIPQDAFMFEGSLRENIDPTGLRSDAELNAYLELIHSDPGATPALRDKLRLDQQIHESTKFSAGEKQLVALVRALVKGSKLMILDEATSSVDPETDALIQRIIQTRFKDVTLISIAHRLHTIANFDKILVMNAGHVAEFDSPLRLYDDSASIFRSLCDKVRLDRAELVRLRTDTAYAASMAQDRSSLLYLYTIADAFLERGPIYTSYYPRTPPNSAVSSIYSSHARPFSLRSP